MTSNTPVRDGVPWANAGSCQNRVMNDLGSGVLARQGALVRSRAVTSTMGMTRS